ncbi:MAG: major capsid protein P2 [Magnetospiraceae bacterium]
MKQFTSLNSFATVTPGATATLGITPEGVYHQLRLYYTSGAGNTPATAATVAAEIDEIRVKINGKTQRRLTGAQLVMLNALHDRVWNDGRVILFFAEPWRLTAQAAELLAWGMVGVDRFEVEVDINAAAVNPKLTATALWSPENRPLGAIVKYHTVNIDVTATGPKQVLDFPRENAYVGLHCLTTDINSAKVTVNKGIVLDDIDIADLHEYIDDHGLVPQAGWSHVMFDRERRLSDPLPMAVQTGKNRAVKVAEFKVEFDMAAANPFEVLLERVGPAD